MCIYVPACSCTKFPPEDFCSDALLSTHYAPSTLGISVNLDDLTDEVKKIRNLPEFTKCLELINTLICIITYPPCNASTEKLIPICESKCLSIDAQIPRCLLYLENNLLMTDFPLVEELLRSVECDEPESYYNFPSHYIETNSTDCIMISKNIYAVIAMYMYLTIC